MKHQSGYALTLMLLLAGCGGGGGDGSSATTKLNLAISDAPVDSARKVCIAINGLRLKLNGSSTESVWSNLNLLQTTNNDGCLPTGYTIPQDTSGNPAFLYLDLLKYRNGAKQALLTNTSIPSGTYEQLRLMVEDGRTNFLNDTAGIATAQPTSYVEESDGTILPLQVPSGEVKTTTPFTAAIGGVLSFQLEFNLRHALVLPGTNTYYKLKPTGVKLLSVSTLSTISGNVNSLYCGGDLSTAGVYLYNSDNITPPYLGIDYDPANGGPVVTSLVSTTDNVSSYQLNYVEPGTYDVALVCNAANDTLSDNGNESTFVPNIAEVHTGIIAPSSSGATAITNSFVTP
ncbi:MAG: DUF4382 domain-containing protein [Tolumonas sp.]|nr:DUF4382 domain-containing protein [Tolumonas sp.]